MTNKLKGTKTEQILINSFAGESQARNRYTYFSKVAKEEGYEQISAIFLATAENELQHAKLFYKHIGDNPNAHVDAFYPFKLGTTEENLKFSEQHHAKRYKEIYENLVKGTTYKKDKKVEWICRKCGYVFVGDEAPHLCPCCKHPRAYFELLSEKY